jgi:hypothetical protein
MFLPKQKTDLYSLILYFQIITHKVIIQATIIPLSKRGCQANLMPLCTKLNLNLSFFVPILNIGLIL